MELGNGVQPRREDETERGCGYWRQETEARRAMTSGGV
jgi:hypothetical protein